MLGLSGCYFWEKWSFWKALVSGFVCCLAVGIAGWGCTGHFRLEDGELPATLYYGYLLERNNRRQPSIAAVKTRFNVRIVHEDIQVD